MDRGAGRVVLADLEETKKDVTRLWVVMFSLFCTWENLAGQEGCDQVVGRDVLSIMQFGVLEF